MSVSMNSTMSRPQEVIVSPSGMPMMMPQSGEPMMAPAPGYPMMMAPVPGHPMMIPSGYPMSMSRGHSSIGSGSSSEIRGWTSPTKSAQMQIPQSPGLKNPGFLGSCTSSGCCGGEGLCCGRCSKCCEGNERMVIKLQADQAVVPVPVYQEVLRKNKYVEVPQIELTDTLIPKVYMQSAIHDVPQVDLNYSNKDVPITTVKTIERDVEVPVPMGYSPKFVPKWDVREVPRPVPRYEGEQEVVEVEVPQIQYRDKYVDKEVVVDVREKIVPKITEVEKQVEVIKYEWKEQYQDVPVYKYLPRFDVELDCPQPLIVPYTETKVVRDPPVIEKASCCPSVCCRPNYAELTGGYTSPDSRYTNGMISNMARNSGMHIDPKTGYPTGFPHPPNSDYAMAFQKSHTQTYKLEGGFTDGEPLRAQLSKLGGAIQGPVYPLPSPQVDAEHQEDRMAEGRIQESEPTSWWSKLWPFTQGGEKDSSDQIAQQSTNQHGYPPNLPQDFAPYFKQDMQDVMKQHAAHPVIEEPRGGETEEEAGQMGVLEPTVEYKGAINKSPEYGGDLDPISFKLHAIEIHQFIPLPNQSIPQFIQAMPNGTAAADATDLESFFGPVPAGWADPGITGMPAPMMSDILHGNVHSQSPLYHQISMQGESGREITRLTTGACGEEVVTPEAAELSSLSRSISFHTSTRTPMDLTVE